MKPFERERRARTRERRKEFEFSRKTKNDVSAINNGYCEICKTRKGEEYHHIISIEEAIDSGYDPKIITATDNCLLVCRICHQTI